MSQVPLPGQRLLARMMLGAQPLKLYPRCRLISHPSFCNKEEEILISSSTWKVAMLELDLLDDLGLLIVRPAAR
tara:strand:+ start:645 stop:866 length:222 start_codon:yes stop_codon:yes gene_type:complete